MKILERLGDRLEHDFPLHSLIKIVLVLLSILLIQMTGSIWVSILHKLRVILTPFVFGFAIAYVLRKPIRWGTDHRIPRNLMILAVYVVILIFLYWLISSLVPMLLTRATGFITNIINGVNWLYGKYESMAENGVPEWIHTIVQQAVSALSSFQGIIPNLPANLPNVITNVLSSVTNVIFTVMISLYMCFQWDRIRFWIIRIRRRHSRRTAEGLFLVNDELTAYLRSMLLSMAVKFVEYAILYFCIGNQDWLILALLTSIGLIVPYIGPIIANCFGILTSLSLPLPNILILLAAIVILSNVDEYVITPILRARTTSVTPLWALFSIYAGGTLFGMVGIVIAIPVYLSIQALLKLYGKDAGFGEQKEEANGTSS